MRKLAAVTLILIAGCTLSEATVPPVVQRDSAGVVIVESDVTRIGASCPLAAEPAVVIGSADRGEEYELYHVFGAAQLSDGRIALVDGASNQLRIYDAQGRFLMSSGRAGGGPGEFQNAYYLWVLPGDSIWVGDYGPWQFHIFSSDGQYVRTVRPHPQYAGSPQIIDVLDDGKSVLSKGDFASFRRQFEPRPLTIILHDANGELQDTIGTYDNGQWGQVGENQRFGVYRLFESFLQVDAADRRIVIGHGSTPEVSIYETVPALHLSRIARWTTESRLVTSEEIRAERGRLASLYHDAPPAEQDVVLALTGEDRPVAEEYPAFVRTLVGRDGRIWIHEFERPSLESPGQRWIVLDTEGHLVCQASLPEVDQVLEFGGDYMLALDRDEFDVERVVRYQLQEIR